MITIEQNDRKCGQKLHTLVSVASHVTFVAMETRSLKTGLAKPFVWQHSQLWRNDNKQIRILLPKMSWFRLRNKCCRAGGARNRNSRPGTRTITTLVSLPEECRCQSRPGRVCTCVTQLDGWRMASRHAWPARRLPCLFHQPFLLLLFFRFFQRVQELLWHQAACIAGSWWRSPRWWNLRDRKNFHHVLRYDTSLSYCLCQWKGGACPRWFSWRVVFHDYGALGCVSSLPASPATSVSLPSSLAPLSSPPALQPSPLVPTRELVLTFEKQKKKDLVLTSGGAFFFCIQGMFQWAGRPNICIFVLFWAHVHLYCLSWMNFKGIFLSIYL